MARTIPSPSRSNSFPGHCEHDGIVITVRAAPKAHREGIEGVEQRPRGAALKIAISAAPSGGRANARLVELIAAALDVAKSAISIRTGTASRDKTVFVAGEPVLLLRSLERIVKGRHG